MRGKDTSEERDGGQVVAFRPVEGNLSCALVEMDDVYAVKKDSPTYLEP